LVDTGRVEWIAPAATPSLSAAAALDRVPAATPVLLTTAGHALLTPGGGGPRRARVPAPTPVLLTTADHALLTPAVVDHFCEAARATGADVVVGLARAEQGSTALP